MSHPATIDHKEVHVDLHKHGPVVTNQPATNNCNNNNELTIGNVQYDPHTAMAVFVQGPAPIVAQKPDPKLKPKDFVNTSCFVVFACNFIFGLLGYNYGVRSNHAWRLGDIHQAKVHAKKALTFVIIGIIVGLATYGIAIGLFLDHNN